MIPDWPTACVALGLIAGAVVLAVKLAPYLVGRSTAEAQRAALDEVTKRLNAVESHLVSGQRRMPGRLG